MSAFTQTVCPSQLPVYLRAGSFYLSLDQDNDEAVSVPHGVLKEDLNITSQQDLDHALESVRFWGLDQVPDEIVAFILSMPDVSVAKYESEFPCLPLVVSLQSETDNQKRLNACILQGSLHMVEYFVRKGCPVAAPCVQKAVKSGHLDIVKFLIDKAPPQKARPKFELCLDAFRTGHIHCLQYFDSLGYMDDFKTWTVVQRKAGNNLINALNLETVQYAHHLGFNLNKGLLRSAARCGDLEVMQYAHRNGFDLDNEVATELSKIHNLPCLQYYLEHANTAGNIYMASIMLRNMVMGGWLEGMKCVYEKTHCPLNTIATREATVSDSLECLQYLHEIGCPWDESATLTAARFKSLRCLKFACENGCPLSPEALVCAQENGNTEMVAYLLSLGSATSAV